MFIEQCKLGFIYAKPLEETYVSVNSLANYLQVMAMDIRVEDELPDEFAEFLDTFASGVESAAKEFEREHVNVSD